MSAFLGPIHYWLYNKIEVEENILQGIINFANTKEIDTKDLVSESVKKFGGKIVGNLEDNINQDNIHGWLQGRITSVELRLGYTITNLLKDDKLTFEEINSVFEENANICAKKVNLSDDTPVAIYQEIYNNLLAGMPCDRVNEVVENTSKSVKWETTIDIHKEHWDNVSGNVNLYHILEENWIKTFVKTVNPNFEYKKENGLNVIEVI